MNIFIQNTFVIIIVFGLLIQLHCETEEESANKLQQLLDDYPLDATSIELSDSSRPIHYLGPFAFRNYTEVQSLSLRSLGIKSIHKDAFRGNT